MTTLHHHSLTLEGVGHSHPTVLQYAASRCSVFICCYEDLLYCYGPFKVHYTLERAVETGEGLLSGKINLNKSELKTLSECILLIAAVRKVTKLQDPDMPRHDP